MLASWLTLSIKTYENALKEILFLEGCYVIREVFLPNRETWYYILKVQISSKGGMSIQDNEVRHRRITAYICELELTYPVSYIYSHIIIPYCKTSRGEWNDINITIEESIRELLSINP